MKSPEVSGIVYDKENLTSLRNELIGLRDTALGTGRFDWAVILSHVVGVMYHFIEELDK
jgi:hypothetical protein